jgi:ElaB/YqjD/DUF883 family membrane-anchored ribosome-binding protein
LRWYGLARDPIDRLHKKYGDLKERVGEWEENAEDKIKEHPTRSVLIAFGAGLLAGAIVSALMRKR